MANLVAAVARQLVLLLLVTSGGDGGGARTPVFRGAMSLSGRAIALFEVQGNAGTWQGEVGRTLPGSAWKIERIDLATGVVAVRVGQRGPVVLGVGDTYVNDRVVKGVDPARAPAPLSREETGTRIALRPMGAGTGGQAAMEAQLMRQLADPRMQQQLKALGLPFGQLGGAGQQAGATAQPALRDVAPASAPASPPANVSTVPLVRAVDASVTVPPISSLGKPGYQTVVMLMSGANAECQALKPRVLSLTRRPRTAVVFVDMGAREDAPVRTAWNVPALPHFMLIDAGGGVLGSGESARRVVDSWLGQK